MVQLNDLPEECLLMVMDRLSPKEWFNLLGVNKKLNRLAEEKIGTKINVIVLSGWKANLIECSHINKQNEVLFLWSVLPKYLTIRETNRQISKELRFLNLLSRCASVKSIDFGCSRVPDGLLLGVVRRFSQIECIKINYLSVKEDEWIQALNLIGHQLVHFKKEQDFNQNISEARLLELVASKCSNIKRLDWISLTAISNLIPAFRMLPSNCWVNIIGAVFDKFEDIFDELEIDELNWSLLSQRIKRLSSLKVKRGFIHKPLIRGPEFVKLKKLVLSSLNDDKNHFLAASRFPQLQVFQFSASIGLAEDEYDRVFQRMASVKKLTIISNLRQGKVLRLPRLAIHRLEKLETIFLNFWFNQENWQPTDILEQLEEYVDGIETLKKLTVQGSGNRFIMQLIENELKRIKLKQSRVEVEFIIRN